MDIIFVNGNNSWKFHYDDRSIVKEVSQMDGRTEGQMDGRTEVFLELLGPS